MTPVTVKARVPVPLKAGTPVKTGGEVTFDGFPGVTGAVVSAEVAQDGWLDLELEIDERSRIAHLLRAGAAGGLST